MSDTIRVSVVLENAADEVVTARLGRARAAGIRRVVTEGLVDMGDTRPTPLCVPEDLLTRLGLQEQDRRWDERRCAGPITVRIGGRRTSGDCLVGPRQALGGQVFDVLGKLEFEGRPLRKLLLDAIRYGEQPEVRAHLEYRHRPSARPGDAAAMQALRSLVVAVVAFVVLAVPAVVLADGRVALVVGNSTYAHIGRLPNPDNDARDMSAALRRLGFEVTTEFDADRVELTEALRAFTRQSAGADVVSLVFYAGHGIEMDGVNYLVPVDARLERDVDVRFETVTVDDLLVSTSGASLRILILDACRNNPLARSMQRTAAIRSVSGGSFADLNEDLLGDETLVAYAAAAGTTAADGAAASAAPCGAAMSNSPTRAPPTTAAQSSRLIDSK